MANKPGDVKQWMRELRPALRLVAEEGLYLSAALRACGLLEDRWRSRIKKHRELREAVDVALAKGREAREWAAFQAWRRAQASERRRRAAVRARTKTARERAAS